MSIQTANETETQLGRMNGQDALNAVRAANRRRNLSVSDADEAVMAHQLANGLRRDPTTGETIVVDASGGATDISADEFLLTLQRVVSPLPQTVAKEPMVPVSAKSVARRAMTPDTADAADIVQRFGNPWLTGNRTHQTLVRSKNPVLASQLQNVAGQGNKA